MASTIDSADTVDSINELGYVKDLASNLDSLNTEKDLASNSDSLNTEAVCANEVTNLEWYDMSNGEGLCLFFNNINFSSENFNLPRRDGAENDKNLVIELFKYLGFKEENIHYYEDYTREQIEEALDQVRMDEIAKFSCVACCVSTHGNGHGFFAAKNMLYELEILLDPFLRNEKLKGKPKLFFIQACLGTQLDAGCEVLTSRLDGGTFLIEVPEKVYLREMKKRIGRWLKGGTITTYMEEDSDRIHNIYVSIAYPREPDFLLHFATVPGFISFRDSAKGSWFFNELHSVLQDSTELNKRESDLLSLLTVVNRNVAYNYISSCLGEDVKHEDNKKQQPSMYHTLKRRISVPLFTPCSSAGTIPKAKGESLTDACIVEDAETEEYVKLKVPVLNITAESDLYDTSGQRRGLCLIFNHKRFKMSLTDRNTIPRMTGERKGTNIDANLLEETFLALDFEVRKFESKLTRKKIKKKLEVVRRENHSDADCFVCCVLTSSTSHGELRALDDCYDFEEILKPFFGDKCSTLRGKPKIFFIQSCYRTYHYRVPIGKGYKVTPQAIPITSDILVHRSNVAGDHSWANGEPSFFVKRLTTALNHISQPGNTSDLLSLLTTVNEQVTEDIEAVIKQMDSVKINEEIRTNVEDEFDEQLLQQKRIWIYHTLTRKIHFPPKILNRSNHQ